MDNALTMLTHFGALEAVGPEETTYLGVARPRQPELLRERPDASIDLGHWLM